MAPIGEGERAEGPGGAADARRLLAIVTDAILAEEAIEQVRVRAGAGANVRVVAPAVEPTLFRHALGDVDEASRRAERVVESSLAALRRSGLDASGAVGDPDPVLAAEDALREGPADEVVIFEREAAQARWFEEGLFERAQERLEPPLAMVLLHDDADGAHVVGVENAAAGTADPAQREVEISANLPRFSVGDLTGMVTGVVGTIVAIVLAAAAASGSGPEAGWKAVAIGVAIAVALINMAHVVGLTLFESVRYRGGFERFFRTLSMVATPLAIVVNALILLLA
jgi:hypothetical protein